MAEIDRIIAKGIINKEYIIPENLDGFYVDEKRKKIWAVELDLLVEFQETCQKHDLKYYLYAGSLLGAIRHKGFIPWDDDIDVVMFREDYEKLKTLDNEFESPYFLQTPYTDSGYLYSFTRLRNSNTCGISFKFAYEQWNQGLYIDIFPLDVMIPEREEARRAQIEELILDNSTYMRMSNPNLDDSDLLRIKNYSGRDPLEVNERIQNLAQEFNDSESIYIGTPTNTIYSWQRYMYMKEDYSDSISVDFSVVHAEVPIGYENILKTTYGDYMSYPPLEERGVWHDKNHFDPDISYREYINRLRCVEQ